LFGTVCGVLANALTLFETTQPLANAPKPIANTAENKMDRTLRVGRVPFGLIKTPES
jgi:hypothetical protein